MSSAADNNPNPIRLLVASTVYNYQDQLNQICGVLSSYVGYEIWNSHFGTMPTHPGKSNLENCLQAVRDRDAFFGIIRPFYGSGVVGERSITHEEMRLAVRLKKPRWFLVHGHVTFARQLLRQFIYRQDGKRRARPMKFKPTKVLDDLRVIEMYDDVAQNDIPVHERKGHWVQEFLDQSQALRTIETEFRDAGRVRKIISEMNDDR